MRLPTAGAFPLLALLLGLMPPVGALITGLTAFAPPPLLAQAMVPPTGANDADKPMAAEERMRRRFPQPVRVADLIGLPVLDDNDSTIGRVREVVRTKQGKIQLIVAYGGVLGLGARPVAVPIEVVAILGRQLASLDMPPSEYAAAPTWQARDAQVLANDDSVQVALGRR